MNNKKNSVACYQWTGITPTGEKVQGLFEATDITSVKMMLRSQGIISKKIRKKTNPLFDKKRKKIIPADIAFFSRQLATLIKAGIPIIQSLDLVAESQDHQSMRKLIAKIKYDIEIGSSLAESFHKHPQCFNTLYCSLIDAGEKSGSLELTLDKAARYKEKIEILKKKMKKSLAYPLAVLVVAFFVTTALLCFVVPQFESLFNDFGADLPLLTRSVIRVSVFFKSYWSFFLGTLIGGVYAFRYILNRSPQLKYRLDQLLLTLPLIGSLLANTNIARFSQTLSITFAAGIPLVEALLYAGSTLSNSLYRKTIDKIRQEIVSGQPIRIAMENTRLFPSLAIQMIAIGEESGCLESMLSHVADFYEQEVDNTIEILNSLLEPLILSFVGVVIGVLVVAMYLPLFKLSAIT